MPRPEEPRLLRPQQWDERMGEGESFPFWQPRRANHSENKMHTELIFSGR